MEMYQRYGPGEPVGANVVASDQRGIQEQLARILSSELFTKSPQLSRFLRFCVEQTLLGRQDALKEQVLGTEVFRRASPFDPRLDPIVRVEARRLRAKLDQYYLAEGVADPLIITFQRGDYVPRFVRAIAGADRLVSTTQSARIVIVEDERVVAKDLENRLKGLGYTVLDSVSSGEAALQAVEHHRPDIVLMDIVLAGAMRGTEAARRIWDRYRIPVVYLTAFSDAIVLEDIKGSEPYGYLLKPFEPKQLHAVLQLALSRRAKESQDTDAGSERARIDALTSALENARIGMWEWLVRDPSLPWPESVECPSKPVLCETRQTASDFLENILPMDRDRTIAAFTDAIRTRSHIDVTYRRGDGPNKVEWVIATGKVVEDLRGLRCSGVEIGASAAIRPDSARKVAELEHFVIAAGHDLQEPLKTIKAYTQLLAKRSHDSDPVSESVLTHIEGGVDQADALVSDLLAYIRLSREDHASFEVLPIDTAVDMALWNLQEAIMASGARVSRTPMPSVMANKMQIVQLFQNLVSNAIKFRQEHIPPELHISSVLEDGQWHFSIRDNGLGFESGHAEHIFEPFHRLNGRSTHLTGLGLAVCRRIVEHHGGRIWAESDPGNGSTFHFTLLNAPGPAPSEAV